MCVTGVFPCMSVCLFGERKREIERGGGGGGGGTRVPLDTDLSFRISEWPTGEGQLRSATCFSGTGGETLI